MLPYMIDAGVNDYSILPFNSARASKANVPKGRLAFIASLYKRNL